LSSYPGQSSPIASQLRALRTSGCLGPALELASQVVSRHRDDGGAMVEAVCVLICLGQGQSAAQLYQALAADQIQENSLAPEALVRLALLLERRDLLEDMKSPAEPPWLVELLSSRNDPTGTLSVTKVDIKEDNGHPVFTLIGTCPHCEQNLKREFRTSLLVQVEWICPWCFGLVEVDFAAARTALENMFGGEDSVDLKQMDRDLIDYLRPGLTGSAPGPRIVQALAQEYHFLLNELILEFAAAGPDGESSP
jgi:hypothetical protein